MKKVRVLIISIFVLGILTVNLSIIGNTNDNGNLSLSSLQTALASGEDPPIPDKYDDIVVSCTWEGYSEWQVDDYGQDFYGPVVHSGFKTVCALDPYGPDTSCRYETLCR